MFDVGVRSEIVFAIVSSLNKLSALVFFILIAMALMSAGFEPFYCCLCNVFKWDKLGDPSREIIKFCTKATLAELAFFILTSDKALMEYIRLFDKIVSLGG